MVHLPDLGTREAGERAMGSLASVEIRRCLSALKDELVARTGRPSIPETVGQAAPRLIKLHAGCVSIDDMARRHGLSRQQFARRFCAAAGLLPKLFARITRFHALVHALLSTDVSQWASVSSAVGFYDPAHMMNEFRAFAGSPPTIFFRPHGSDIDPPKIQLCRRPRAGLRQPQPLPAHNF